MFNFKAAYDAELMQALGCGIPETEARSLAYAEAKRQEQAARTSVAPTGPTFGDVTRGLIAALETATKPKKATRSQYQRVAQKILGEWGISEEPITSLTRDTLQALVDRQTPGMQREYVKRLRDIFARAVDFGHVTHNPATKLTYEKFAPKVDRKRPGSGETGHQRWEREELAQFRRHWPVGTLERLVFEFLVGTGQRIADIAALTWEQFRIKPDGVWVTFVQGKTTADVIVCLPRSVLDVLPAQLPTAGRVVKGSRGGTFDGESLSNRMTLAYRTANLPLWCVSHGLRKTAGCLLIEAGARVDTVQRMLGHFSRDMTVYYIRAAKGEQAAREACDALNRVNAEMAKAA